QCAFAACSLASRRETVATAKPCGCRHPYAVKSVRLPHDLNASNAIFPSEAWVLRKSLRKRVVTKNGDDRVGPWCDPVDPRLYFRDPRALDDWHHPRRHRRRALVGRRGWRTVGPASVLVNGRALLSPEQAETVRGRGVNNRKGGFLAADG